MTDEEATVTPPAMDREQVRAWAARWREVDDVIREERRQMTDLGRWQRLDAIMQTAAACRVVPNAERRGADVAEVRARWVRLKQEVARL